MFLRISVFILILIFSLSFTRCNKEKNTTYIKGVVESKVENILVNNVVVNFYTKTSSGGAYSNAFNLIDSESTLENGEFNFSFIKSAADIEYKIEFIKTDYITKTVLINPSQVKGGSGYESNVDLLPMANIKFNIRATSNTGNTDQLIFTFNNELELATSYVGVLFTGPMVDTILPSLVIAEKMIPYSYILKRNGQYLSVFDSVLITKGETKLLEVIY